MASKSNFRRWILVGLVALGVVVAATLPRRGSDEAEEPAPEPAETREAPPRQDREPAPELDGVKASRRITVGCQPLEESLKYEKFIGERALAILSWNGMSEQAANLEIPVYVQAVEDGGVGVRFMQFPMREQYLGVWIGSGHIEHADKDVFLLDPCSATIVAWPELERDTTAED